MLVIFSSHNIFPLFKPGLDGEAEVNRIHRGTCPSNGSGSWRVKVRPLTPRVKRTGVRAFKMLTRQIPSNTWVLY